MHIDAYDIQVQLDDTPLFVAARFNSLATLSAPVCFLPGFAQWPSLVGNYAVIGISRPRDNRTFEGLTRGKMLEAIRLNEKRSPWNP